MRKKKKTWDNYVLVDGKLCPAPPKKQNKYGNRSVYYGGKWFQSIRERDYYIILLDKLKYNEIVNFECQVPFVLIPGKHTLSGKDRRYFADFTVMNLDGSMDVIDAKGKATELYKWKRDLMKMIHNIEIKEV